MSTKYLFKNSKNLGLGLGPMLRRERVAKISSGYAVFLALAACGGSGGSVPVVPAPVTPPVVSAPVVSTPSAPPPVTVPSSPVSNSHCLDGNVGSAPGADDPFYVNAWHLENTGPTQTVSANANAGVAGIDANVKAVHMNGRGCTGRGITLAILDSGLELAHEDLSTNILAGKSFNFTNNGNNPSPAWLSFELDHGTGVAGVAAARGWNGRGSRGTAPSVSLVGFNVLGGTFKPSANANVGDNVAYLSVGASSLADKTIPGTLAFGTRADSVDIFNMSFGVDYAGAPTIDVPEAMHLGIKKGTETLRNGLGAVYLQSAGNEFVAMARGTLPSGDELAVNCGETLSSDLQPTGALAGSVFSNLAGQTCGSPNHEPWNKPYAYQIAAMHNTGKASSYSSSGASNWVAGFGGESGKAEAAIISTDNSTCISGANNVYLKSEFEAFFTPLVNAFKTLADLFGASNKDPGCNYTGQMNGTSAAAPSVSGIAALMLEANPKLSWQDVGYIMAKTARKVDADIASGARAVTFTAAGTTSKLDLDKPWQVNSAGFHFQNRYGFGMVDAAAAVKLARDFVTPAGRRTTDLTAVGAASAVLDTGNGAYAVNSAAVTFADMLAVSGQMRVELEITNHTGAPLNPGRVQFELVNNKTEQTSILLPAFTSWYVGGKTDSLVANGKQKFRFHTNAFYGDKLADGYTVRVVNIKSADATSGALSFTPSVTSFSL